MKSKCVIHKNTVSEVKTENFLKMMVILRICMHLHNFVFFDEYYVIYELPSDVETKVYHLSEVSWEIV